ncbi:unnamed protein product [Closterium sp. Naga37s-1]|nr:unnamed protein product [Closterium sp. Naga37s-1]
MPSPAPSTGPTSVPGGDAYRRQRATAEYSCQDDAPFIITQHRYRSQQFASLYFSRLATLRPVLLAAARQKWPHLPVSSVLDLADKGECVVVGTLYKQMKLKPSILQDYGRERASAPLVAVGGGSLVGEDDSTVLEDERGRVKLVGNAFLPAAWVTGVVVAVRGCEDSKGNFRAMEVLEPGMPLQDTFPAASASANTAAAANQAPPRYVAFVSGLHLSVPTTTASTTAAGAPSPSPPPAATPPSSQGRGSEGAEEGGGDAMLHKEMLLDLLSGHVHSDEEERLSAGIVRVVIAGDSCSFSHLPQSLHDTVNSTSLAHRDAKAMAAPVKALDTFLSELSASVPVDIMPGACDPANYSLPQQPLHPCLLPQASRRASVVRATNPHHFTLGGVRFLGTAGQNIQDMRRLCLTRLLHAPPPAAAATDAAAGAGAAVNADSATAAVPMEGVEQQEREKVGKGDDREEKGEEAETEEEEEAGVLDLMQRCLEWRHVAPSAPDTLGVYPFQLDDPFVLTTCPHVFFAGNQPRFATRLIRGPQKQLVRLVAIPNSFSLHFPTPRYLQSSFSFLIFPFSNSPSSPTSPSFRILLAQVDLDSLECRVLSVACPPFPSSPSRSS